MRIPLGLRAAAGAGGGGGWDLDSATYTGVSYSLGTGLLGDPAGLTFDSTGDYLYEISTTGSRVWRLDMSTPYDISSISGSQDYVPSLAGQPRGISVKPDGTAFFIVDSTTTDRIRRFDMSTAWDLTTSSFTSQYAGINTIDTQPSGLFIRDNGTDVYTTGYTNDIIAQWEMTTAWDITTLSHVRSFSVPGSDLNPYDVWFKPDGTRMFYLSNSSVKVVQCELSTPWDISSASASKSFSVSTQETSPRALTLNPSGTIMLVAGSDNDAIYEYSL